MTANRWIGLMGLARRAGQLEAGSFLTEKSIRAGKAKLVLLAEDASDNTRKAITDACTYRKVPLVTVLKKTELGHAVGLEDRVCLCITGESFAGRILELLEKETDQMKK